MTFPSSGTSTTLAEGLDSARAQASNIKALATRYSTTMSSTTVSSYEMFYLLDAFISAKTALTAIAALDGMDTYAEAQLGQSVGSDFTAMVNALTNAGAWIVTNFPKDSNGYLLAETFNSDGTRSARNFTTTQTSGLVTLLNTLSNTID